MEQAIKEGIFYITDDGMLLLTKKGKELKNNLPDYVPAIKPPLGNIKT